MTMHAMHAAAIMPHAPLAPASTPKAAPANANVKQGNA
jgi:hypothetical protein